MKKQSIEREKRLQLNRETLVRLVTGDGGTVTEWTCPDNPSKAAGCLVSS